jgi:PAS domain S-box-containing protein
MPTKITKAGIGTILWVSFGVVLLILGATLLIYASHARQVSSQAGLLSSTHSFEQATSEMRQSNSDVARFLSEYASNPGRNYARELGDAETAFDRAALTFSQLAPTFEATSQSQEVNNLFVKLRKSTDDVVSLVDQEQAAFISISGTSGEVNDLMQGMVSATIDDSSSESGEKLGIVLDMNRSLIEISSGIDAYVRGPDPAVQQQVANAGEDFNRFSNSFQGLDLSPLESSWVTHIKSQVEQLLSDSTDLFTAKINFANAMTQFETSSSDVETFLTEQVQPLVDAEIMAASKSLGSSAASANLWLIILAIIAVITGIAAVAVISRRITGPLHRLLGGVALVASGRVEHRFNSDDQGEFGQLALGLNKMLDNIKRSRDALGESEELAWTLLDATRDAVILTDLRGTILASNEIAAKRFDRSLEQMVDESLYDLLPAESTASLRAHVAELMRSKKPVHYEDERAGKIIEHDIYPVSEHKGEISRIAFFSRDVTMRKWVEDVTEQLARRNTMILESAGEGIFGLDVDGKTTFVNAAAAAMHGYKAEELIGKKHHDLVHHSRPDGKLYPPEQCPVHATLKDGIVHSNVDDEVFWRKDGTAFQVEYTSTPIKEDGRIIGAVITFRDITDRKRVENALKDSEEKYRSVVESASSLIIWLDQEGMVTDCSPRIEQFLGYKPAQIIGHPFLELVQQQDRSRVEEALRVIAKQGFEDHHHFRMVNKRGNSIEVSMNTAVARNGEGGRGRIICMLSAVSQRVSS